MLYLIPDTNQLFVSYEKTKGFNVYNDFIFSNTLSRIIEIKNSQNCIDEITILIPEIVIYEMVQQKYEQYLDDYNNYQILLPRLGLKPSLSMQNRDDFFQESKNQALKVCKKLNLTVLPLCDEHYYLKMINRAIYKEPPFEGKNGKSDKGFKDAILFYSIINYAIHHKGDYYLLSNDTIFTSLDKSKQLKHEFSSLSECLLNIISDLSDLKANIITQRTDSHLDSISYQYEDYKNSASASLSKVPASLYQKRAIFNGDAPIIKILNNKLNQIYSSDINFYENFLCSHVNNDPELTYESSLRTIVTNNSGGLLSFALYDYKYLGGAHGGTAVSAYTFDINIGRQLTLTQLLNTDNSSLCDTINSCIKKEKNASKIGKYYEEEVEISDSNSIVYYIKERKVHIVFNEYELGPFSSGTIDLVLCEIP